MKLISIDKKSPLIEISGHSGLLCSTKFQQSLTKFLSAASNFLRKVYISTIVHVKAAPKQVRGNTRA
ncbi:Protein of unknown function [Pyronema omphalodes CBS 100304]|uniref:Uncharacterized protein n=1 Tax=Pyronema omphalodes (strain CBS 100304) TaxID=1076935 RepID=U4LCX6_PYROM|nr:Protein of unknown function [Pyronema omphalodes CBS 100304]